MKITKDYIRSLIKESLEETMDNRELPLMLNVLEAKALLTFLGKLRNLEPSLRAHGIEIDYLRRKVKEMLQVEKPSYEQEKDYLDRYGNK